jgi:O-antigen/teichoic acid export membrane protein
MLTGLIEKAKRSRLVQNTIWMLLGQGARLPVQALYFVLIARSLGAQGYGAFLGVTALVAILAPFGGLGSGSILIKNVARDETCFRSYWGKTLVVTAATGIFLTLVVFLLSMFLLPASIPFLLVVCVSLADLIFSRFLDASCQAYQAFQRLGRTSQLSFLPFLARLIALFILLVTTKASTPEQWGYYYLSSIVVCAAIGIFLVHRELGTPTFDRDVIFSDLKEGLFFSISNSSLNIYNDIDKTVLARLSTLGAVGIYGAAYRIIDVAFTPVRSLLCASYARFFQSGQGGMRGAVKFAAKLLPYAVGYGLAASLVLFFSAPILPYILGREYTETVLALRWLSLLPLLKSVHYVAADTLTGAGFQGARSFCQILTALLNVMLILWLIPAYSWKGAAWASLASDAFLALTLWLLILRCSKTERTRATQGAALRI